MSMDHLTSLLAANPMDDLGRSPACPDEHQIAGYVDGGLDEAARAQVEGHLVDCKHCLAVVGLLCRERDAEAIELVPREAPVQSPAQVAKRPQRLWHVAKPWAAAAALVLTVSLLLQLGRSLESDGEGQGSPVPVATRSTAPKAGGLQVIEPGAGRAVDVQSVQFRWTEVAGSPYYDVRIVTDAGDLVVQQRVTGTTWRPPTQLNLQPGAEYFVHVDAYPAGDKTVSSDHVLFRVSD